MNNHVRIYVSQDIHESQVYKMIKINDTLFKVSSTGKISMWSVHVDDSAYIVTTGYVDGKQQTFRTNVKDQKNSESCEAQAVLEATSQWNLKRKTMYPTIDEALQAKNNKSLSLGGYSPMLAKELDIKKPSFSLENCYGQSKLDGKRCISVKNNDKVLLYARSGAIQDTTPHINSALNEIMQNGEIWDGELYKHGMELEDILSLSQSTKNRKDTSILQYHVYDFPRIASFVEKDPFTFRLKSFEERMESLDSDNIIGVPTIKLNSFKEIDEYHTSLIDDGYEGAIIRNPIAPYENKRSKNLLKFKKFKDAEFPIVGIEEGRGKLENHVGAFVCQMPDGRTFSAKLSGEISELSKYLDDPNLSIGKMLNIKFFAYTKKGIPRFPVGIRIREDD